MATSENITTSLPDWTVTLRKYRSTWHYFTGNPQGGGFGSSHCGSKRVALGSAIRNIPAGASYLLITENEGREVSRKVEVR